MEDLRHIQALADFRRAAAFAKAFAPVFTARKTATGTASHLTLARRRGPMGGVRREAAQRAILIAAIELGFARIAHDGRVEEINQGGKP